MKFVHKYGMHKIKRIDRVLDSFNFYFSVYLCTKFILIIIYGLLYFFVRFLIYQQQSNQSAWNSARLSVIVSHVSSSILGIVLPGVSKLRANSRKILLCRNQFDGFLANSETNGCEILLGGQAWEFGSDTHSGLHYYKCGLLKHINE